MWGGGGSQGADLGYGCWEVGDVVTGAPVRLLGEWKIHEAASLITSFLLFLFPSLLSPYKMALEFINIYHAPGFLLSSKKPITTFIIIFFPPTKLKAQLFIFSP